MGFYDLVSYFHAKYATIFIVHDSGDFDSGFSKKVRKQE
jgi:lipid A disaccharide synthetase